MPFLFNLQNKKLLLALNQQRNPARTGSKNPETGSQASLNKPLTIVSDVFDGNLSAPANISVVFSANSVFKHRDLREHVYTLDLFVV